MEKLLTFRLARLAARRKPIALAAFLVPGALTLWAAWQAFTPWGVAAGLSASALLAALVYVVLDAARALQKQAAALTETQEQLEALAGSNAALKAARQDAAQQKMLVENLLAVARATAQQPVLENTLQNVLDITAALTGAMHGSLFLLDPQGKIAQHLFTRQDAQLAQPSRLGHALQDGLAGWAARNRQLARSHDTQTDPRWIEMPGSPYPARSAMAVPFVSRGAVIGVLTLTHPQPRHFTEAHEKLLSSAADQIAVAIDNAKMFDTMMRMADRLGLLYSLSDTATHADLDAGLTQALRAIRQATRWPGLAVLLLDASNAELVARASLGSEMPARLAANDALVSEALETRGITSVEDTSLGPLVAASMCAEDRPLGVLLVQGDASASFSAEDVALISSIADTLATAVVNAELRRKIQELSRS